MSKKPPVLALPTIRLGGVEYVKREHFDLAVFAAQQNKLCVISMQKDRDQWKAKAMRAKAAKWRKK